MDRTILPATAGEDASDAAGVAVVKVWQRNPVHSPEHNPQLSLRLGRRQPIRLCHQLLRENPQVKGSQQ